MESKPLTHDEIGRGCSCTCRLAFEPPNESRTRLYRARVEVRDRRLPYSYRVQYLDADDRLMRRARWHWGRPRPPTWM